MLFRAEGLTKRFGSRTVVDGLSFDVHAGEIVGLLGRNGAGKTTAFKMAMGLIPPNAGKVMLNGNEITRLPMYRRAKMGLGYLAQEPSIFQRLTVEENLLAILETQGLSGADCRRRAAELLAEYGLTRVAKQKAHTLSGGETRRLEISRALVTDPKLMLLDEPFSGVDPIAVNDIQGLIRRLKEHGIGILLTDHNVREMLTVTDRSYIIDQGRILAHGSPQEVLANPEARQAYFGEQFRM
ncbi:MAG: LPS export ABC transporter ATP-binding protein [Planctomycetes bacterium]|nr:LPS export ABC transporter ATP-binding protein [Planctomycetota bacterium]